MVLRRLRPAVAACGMLVGLAVLVPTAVGQTELDRARAEVAEATERLEELLDRLEITQRQGNELASQFWLVESELVLLDNQVDQTAVVLGELAEVRTNAEQEVREIAVQSYMDRGEATTLWAEADSVTEQGAQQALAELFVGSERQALDELSAVVADHEATRVALEEQRTARSAALESVADTRAAINAELEELATLRAALDVELGRLETGLVELETAEAERLAAEERARLAAERERAAEAAARAAALAPPTPLPVPTPTPTAVPNPQPSEPLAASGPVFDPSDGVPPEPEPTVPNPQPGEPFPTATVVPSPQPSQPLTTGGATPGPEPTVPNPQPGEPFPTATVVPNPQPSEPVPVAGGGGGIRCPLSGPFTHTDDFNAPRAVGGVHRANDLIAPTGTPVIAVVSGRLQHKEASVGGLSAHLRGDDGNYYFYTHLNGYENVGVDWVPAGTVIGYVGMTGNAPIPHLHFEIHRGGYGNYTNPYGPVRQACF